jgi:hypothetical protein
VINALFIGNLSVICAQSSFPDTLYVEPGFTYIDLPQMTSTIWYMPIGVPFGTSESTYDGYFVASVAFNRCENKCNWGELCNCVVSYFTGPLIRVLVV